MNSASNSPSKLPEVIITDNPCQLNRSHIQNDNKVRPTLSEYIKVTLVSFNPMSRFGAYLFNSKI